MRKLLLLPITMAGIALSLACGKGGTDATTSTPAASTPSAVVQAVVGGTEDAPMVNQAALVTSGATVALDGVSAAVTTVQPGVVMAGTTTPGGLPSGSGPVTMRTIHLRSSFLGAIQAIDTSASTLTVMGQVIQVDALTHLAQANQDGSHTSLTLADFVLADYVIVFGNFQTDGSFLATRVERAAPGADTSRSGISGTISALDTTAKTFTLGAWTVSYAAATVHGTLANGVAAEVRGTASGTTLTAGVVNVAMAEGDPGCPAGLRGKVQNLDATAKTFQLLTMTVNYAAATVDGTLAEGVMVEVQGTLASGSTTLLNATRVIVTLAGGRGGCPSDKQAMGAITALDLTAMTVTVSGTTFWLDAATVIMAKDATLTVDQLKVGDWVAVLADASKTDTAGDAYATRIVVIPAAPVNPVRCLMGPVTAVDIAAQTLVVNGFTVGVSTATTYTSQATTLPAASFWSAVAVGNLVQVAGTASGTTFTATRINLMPAAPTLMGLVTAMDATAQTLVVSGLTVSVTADTTYASHGAPVSATTFWSTVAVGNLVEAAGTASGTTFTATRILLGDMRGGGHR